MKVPIQTHSKYFYHSSGIVFSEKSAHIGAFRKPTHLYVIADSFSRGEIINKEMSLKETTFQLIQWRAKQLEKDNMASQKKT